MKTFDISITLFLLKKYNYMNSTTTFKTGLKSFILQFKIAKYAFTGKKKLISNIGTKRNCIIVLYKINIMVN